MQVKEAIKLLKPLIPLSFETSRRAFRIPGINYGSISQLLREFKEKDEWLENGDWACFIEIPSGMKADLISKVMNRDSSAEYKDL